MKKIENQSILSGKKILLGVTGSISAYKTPELVRMLLKLGARVKVILTEDAQSFVTPLTLSTVSCNDVIINFTDKNKLKWNNHVELGLWADLFLIAPITANTISKMATGLCDNILLATFLSSKCPIFCAPAMDRDMYLNEIIHCNLSKLRKRGVFVIDPEDGELASGLYGLGRLCSLDKIIIILESFFLKKISLVGKKILITAGPTFEKIDPVRFIGNFSSGKMGCALANSAAQQGAQVDLIIGPSYEKINHPLINRIDIESAAEMYDHCKIKFNDCDIAIFSAAVSDFRPIQLLDKKIKKHKLTIKTELNVDILKTLSINKENQFVVGFALETDNEDENAIRKLQDKNLDLIVLNTVNNQHSYFGKDHNKVKIIDQELNIKTYPLMTKKDIADSVFAEILASNKFSLSKKIIF
jgi:phosphopantothenoylcysteine decarboxylase/phosphopantothenate--cysteine ligase